MSEQEQEAIIGRLVMERVEVNRQRSLLREELRRYTTAVSHLGACLADLESFEAIDRSIVALDDTLGHGQSLDSLKTLLMEYSQLARRALQIDQTLRNAGVQ